MRHHEHLDGHGHTLAGSAGQAAAVCWRFGQVQFDERTLRLSVAGAAVDIERKPVYLLRHLLRHAGETVTKSELESSVWPGRILSDSVLKKCTSRLRQALQDEDETL